jgi:hypothetical protein
MCATVGGSFAAAIGVKVEGQHFFVIAGRARVRIDYASRATRASAVRSQSVSSLSVPPKDQLPSSFELEG